MGLFDSVRGLVAGDDEPGDDDADADAPERPDPTPTTFRNKAADAVADWDAHDLDYSLSSLSRLDDFAETQGAKLDVMHDEGDGSVADLHTRYTIQAGSYLGEVLVRQRDGEWVEDGERWAVSLTYEGEPATVDVFELAGHAFAEEPVFGEVADRFTEDDDEPAEPEPAPLDTDDMAAHAEELAEFWDEYDLDFSPRSLARLDELTDSEWDDDRFEDTELGGEDMDSGMYTELVKQLGSYYGEVLVRSLDAEWTRRDDDIVVAVEGNTNAPPVPVPVFSVAAESLTGPSVFATRFNDLTDRANLEVPAVATTAGVTPASETPAATDSETGDDAATDGDPEPTVDPTDKSPLETAIAETVAAGLADRPEGDEAETAAEPEGGADDGEPGEPDADDEAERAALAAEISDSGPAASGPTLPAPDELHDAAEAFAATYPGYDLDLSPDSLSRLDRLVTEEYDAAAFADFDFDDPDSQFQIDRVIEAGGYFALVIEGTVGGEWERTDEGLQFVVEGAEGVARLDPLGVAADCFRDDDSFAATYAAIRDRLGV